jgi:hypothetical protein
MKHRWIVLEAVGQPLSVLSSAKTAEVINITEGILTKHIFTMRFMHG